MPKRKRPPPDEPISDDEILALDTVPIALAARYLGWSETSVRDSLREGRAPFGIAFHHNGGDQMVYRISPGGLVHYKRSGCEIIPFPQMRTAIQHCVNEAFRRVLEEKGLGLT